MTGAALVAGRASRAGTQAYAASFGRGLAAGHYSEFLNQHYKLSSLGIGTFGGAATDAVDEAYASIVRDAALAGVNVFDTATHYRYGRSMRALGEGLRRAFAAGVGREQVFVIAKAGFLAFAAGAPADFDAWFDANVAAPGQGSREDLAGQHLLSPAYLAAQIEAARSALGLATVDAFLLDQPEVHIPVIGKERTNRKILRAFAVLEAAVRDGRIACYGISTFQGFRVATDAPLFQSLTSLIGLAEKAAREVRGEGAHHAFRVVELPFNQAMTEGFTRFSHATGKGNIASTVQAARQLGVYVVASHTMGKGLLAREAADAVRGALGALANDAQRALQFNRSTPGIGTSLVGISNPAHLADLVAVARVPPLAKEAYVRLYERTA
ncbi:MAG: aldo/keto reductase [Burkholderiales bacterium]|nr:aldo/keto reductase [Burkholderiales bacterium]